MWKFLIITQKKKILLDRKIDILFIIGCVVMFHHNLAKKKKIQLMNYYYIFIILKIDVK